MENELRDRIKMVMEHDNKNSITFSEAIGIQQSTLSHILNGRNRASLDVIMKIHQRYPDINYMWLIDGEGEMEVQPSSDLSAEGQQHQMYFQGSSADAPDLFSQISENSPRPSDGSDFRQESAFKVPSEPAKEIVKQEIRYVEKPARKITEIRIFFDDNTFQIFTCDK